MVFHCTAVRQCPGWILYKQFTQVVQVKNCPVRGLKSTLAEQSTSGIKQGLALPAERLDCGCHHSGGRQQVSKCHSSEVEGCLIEDTQAPDGPELVWVALAPRVLLYATSDNEVW